MNQPHNLLDDWLFVLRRIGPSDARELSVERFMTRKAAHSAMRNLKESGYVQQVGLTSKWSLTDKGRARIAYLSFETNDNAGEKS